MDEKTQTAQEKSLADELLRNERTFDHPTFGPVRIRRPNGRQERLIADIRRKQYQTDLFDDNMKSRDEIEKRAIEKGMWSADIPRRIEELTAKMGEAMAVLEALKFKSLDELLTDYRKNVADLIVLFEGNEEIQDVVRAYFNLDLDPTSEARAKIVENAPSTVVDDLLEDGERLRSQVHLLTEMGKVRKDLEELQKRQSRLFVDSIESRADRAEEMATIYYCITNLESGKPLWPTFEEIYDAPPEQIEKLVWQMHYFRHGILPEFQERLAKYGFTPRLNDTAPSSGDSPAQPTSSSDGELVVTEATSSSPASA